MKKYWINSKWVYGIVLLLLLEIPLGALTYPLSELRELEVIDTLLFEVLDQLIDVEGQKHNFDESLIIFKTSTENDTTKIRTSVLAKNDLLIYLPLVTECPKGYFFYKDILIFAFGEDLDFFFEKSFRKREFPLLGRAIKMRENVLNKQNGILIMFEPIVWIFKHINGQVKFDAAGRFHLLN